MPSSSSTALSCIRSAAWCEPISRRCRTPIHVPIPATLLRKQGNQLDIKLAGYPIQQVNTDERSGGLSTVNIGRAADMAAAAAYENVVNVDLPRTTSFVFWMLGTLMMLMGRVDRRESHLAYFGLLLLALGLHYTTHWWFDVPLPNYAMELALASIVPILSLATILFFLRYAGWRSQPIEVALYAQCLIMPASLLLGGPSRVHTLTSFVDRAHDHRDDRRHGDLSLDHVAP